MNNSDKLKMYRTPGLHDPVWLVVSFVLYALFYVGRIFFINRRFKQKLLNQLSSNEVELKLFSNRLVFLASVLVITIPISLMIQYLNYDITVYERLLFILFSLIPHLFLISVLAFKYLIEPIDLPQQNIRTKKVPEALEDHKMRLTQFMSKNKPFLNPDLKLQDLAKLIGWNRSELSYIINQGFDKNFYDFVNEYRLHHALEKLDRNEHKDYSLDYIASASGFKNYVSFYRIFKRSLKESPKAYLQGLERL